MLLDDTVIHASDDGLRVQLAPQWEIWGPNGGYLAAIALRGAATAVPPGHRPASMSCQFLSTGKMAEAGVSVTPIKKGRSTWCVGVELRQGERSLMQAQVWTTDRRDGPRTERARMPSVPPPATLKTYGEHHEGRSAHPYWTNFDVRPVALPWPGGVEIEPKLQVWFRYHDFSSTANPFADHGRSIIPIDTLLWPTHWRSRADKTEYLAPSLDLSVWFHDVPGTADWLLVETNCDTAGGGLIFGSARVWAQDGRLLATGASQMLHTPRG
jgi:acyl-CoA thioesterase II